MTWRTWPYTAKCQLGTSYITVPPTSIVFNMRARGTVRYKKNTEVKCKYSISVSSQTRLSLYLGHRRYELRFSMFTEVPLLLLFAALVFRCVYLILVDWWFGHSHLIPCYSWSVLCADRSQWADLEGDNVCVNMTPSDLLKQKLHKSSLIATRLFRKYRVEF